MRKKSWVINSNHILISFHNAPSSQQPPKWILSQIPLDSPSHKPKMRRALKRDHLTLISQTGKHLKDTLWLRQLSTCINSWWEWNRRNRMCTGWKVEKHLSVSCCFVYVSWTEQFLCRGNSFRHRRKRGQGIKWVSLYGNGDKWLW